MKKLIAILGAAAFLFTPIFSLQAQDLNQGVMSNPPIKLWDALTASARLENFQTEESVYGNFKVGGATEFVDLTGAYEFNFATQSKNTETLSQHSQVKGQLTLTNAGEATAFGTPFTSIQAQMTGEMIMTAGDSLYLKLDDLTLNVEGAMPDTQAEIEGFKTMLNLVKGNWYHLDLKKMMEGEEFAGFDEAVFMKNLKLDAKSAVQDVIKEIVKEHVKTQQYYDEVFADYDVAPTKLIDPQTEDYQEYLTDEEKKHPIDIEALVKKGILECDGEVYKEENLADAFQSPNCWPAVGYTKQFTDEEQLLIDKLYAYSGEWVHEEGKWYYVEVYGTSVVDSQNLISPDEFEYDDEAIERETNYLMKGVNQFLEAPIFNQRSLISGPQEGFQSYSLNRKGLLNAIKNFSLYAGEPFDPAIEEVMMQRLYQMSLGGVYHVEPSSGVLDHFFARFSIKQPEFLPYFEVNYRYKLTDSKVENVIVAPKDATELEDLDSLF